MQASWENFCNSIGLENDPSKSWRKIKNFLKPKGQRDYPTLCHDDKVAKTNADKVQLFAESVERHFGIESKHFDSNHFNEVNKFKEDNHGYFCPPEDPDDHRFDVGNEHELVEDVNPQSLIKPKGQRDYPTLCHDDKVAKTNADKVQLFAESVERHFVGIESKHFDSNHFNEVNKFKEDNHGYFCPPEDPDDHRFDVGNEHELVEDVNPQSLIKLFKFLKRGKAPGPDTIHNEILMLGTTTSLFHHLAKLFISSIQRGYIPAASKMATLRM